MQNKSINPKLKQKEIAKELGDSSSTLERYRNDIKMKSPCKSNNLRRLPKTSNDDLNRLQMTSREPITKREINCKVVIQLIILVMEELFLNKLFLCHSMAEFIELIKKDTMI